VLLAILMMLSAPDSTALADTTSSWAADSLRARVASAAWLAREGEGRGQVLEPAGVAVDAFGRAYVSDAALHRLQRFDPQGRYLGESGVLGSDTGEMRRPGSVVLLGVLGVGVLDRENRRVESFDLFGRLAGTTLDLADPALEAQVGRIDPTQLAADRGGALYVADPARERVLSFDVSGQFLRELGGFGSRPGQLRGLRGLATGPRGELIVTERTNARVQRIDAGGRPVAAWPLPLDPKGKSGELPVAVDGAGRVAVADETSGSLWLFDSAGSLLGTASGLGHPRALAFGRDSLLYVAGVQPGGVRTIRLGGIRSPDSKP
jgi:DNA-binding beta-propeller fold protein YncE